MSTSESADEEGISSGFQGRTIVSNERLTSSKVEALTSTLQDTNRNLRAVDKMLERYRDLGEQKAAVVNALKEDLLEKEERLRQERRLRQTDSCRECLDHSSHRRSLNGLADVRCTHRPCSVPLHRTPRQQYESGTVSDWEHGGSGGRAAALHWSRDHGLSSAVRFFDDTSIVVGSGNNDHHGDDIHTLHQSIRDLSSERQRLQRELDEERSRRARLEQENQTRLESGSTVKMTDMQQLESLQNDLRAEREIWKMKQEDLCKISSQLKQALLDKRHTEVDLTQERSQPFYNMLVIGDGEKQHFKQPQNDDKSTKLRYVSDANPPVTDSRIVSDNILQHQSTVQGLENQLSAKELQLSRAVRQLEDVQHAAELMRQQSNETISDLQQRLQSARNREEATSREMESRRGQLETERTKIGELKQQAQDTHQQWKTKYKKLEKEVERLQRSRDTAELQSMELERELKSVRSHGGSAVQQFDQLKKQLIELIGVRVQLEEQIHVKDVELNQLKSVKLDLEKDLRDCRQAIDRLENELHSTKERLYATTEDKHRLEDQLSSVHSTAFTSEHQLHSMQKDLQDANVSSSQLAAQLSKMAADNQELKIKAQDQQKIILADREEINSLRQKLHQIVQQEVLHTENHQSRDKESRSAVELVRRLKTERAEYYAQLQTLKVELDEERASSSRYKTQANILQLELDQLTRQLFTSEEDTAMAQHKCYKLHHELLNNTTRQQRNLSENEKHVIDY